MKYIENKNIEVDKLIELYNSVGWKAYTNDVNVMENIIPNSLWNLACYDEEKLVGLIRVIGDGVYITYVQDIIVNPDYQRQGIGKSLILQAFTKFKNTRQFVLITDNEEKTKAFYESIGMYTIDKTEGLCFIKYNTNK